MTRSNIHDITVLFETETDKAFGVKEYEGAPTVFFPKSKSECVPHEGSMLVKGKPCQITAEEWLLEEKGLI